MGAQGVAAGRAELARGVGSGMVRLEREAGEGLGARGVMGLVDRENLRRIGQRVARVD